VHRLIGQSPKLIVGGGSEGASDALFGLNEIGFCITTACVHENLPRSKVTSFPTVAIKPVLSTCFLEFASRRSPANPSPVHHGPTLEYWEGRRDEEPPGKCETRIWRMLLTSWKGGISSELGLQTHCIISGNASKMLPLLVFAVWLRGSGPCISLTGANRPELLSSLPGWIRSGQFRGISATPGKPPAE